MILDWLFYALAVPAILLVGISKGSGFGTGGNLIAVPLLALVIPIQEAIGFLLPVLCLMDLYGMWLYWGKWDGKNLVTLVSGMCFGVLLGALTASLLSSSVIIGLVGLVALWFSLDHWLRRDRKARAFSVWSGLFWGTISGFTSFIAHAGGPGAAMHLIPQRLAPVLMVGTNVMAFALINAVKIIPFAVLGQLTVSHLTSVALLSPLAPLGMWLGFRLRQRLSSELFYRISYVLIFAIGVGLVIKAGWSNG